MNFLKALGIGLATYLGMVLAVVLFPVLVLLALWIGLCGFSAIFLFFFWLLVTHNPHTLHSSLYMLAWGAPPCMGFSVLGFYYGQLRASPNGRCAWTHRLNKRGRDFDFSSEH